MEDPNNAEDVLLLLRRGEENDCVGQDIQCRRVFQSLPNAMPRSQTERTHRLLQVLNDALELVEDDDTMDWE